MENKQNQNNPRIQNLLKCLLWAQNQLDQKGIKFRKMTDLASASFEP